jgi:hypothetical protein
MHRHARRTPLAIALLLGLSVALSGCQSGGGGAPTPATEAGTVTLCSATVPEPDATEEACQEVPFTYEVPPTP